MHDDDKLTSALGDLPRAAAAPQFTARVLARVRTDGRRVPSPVWLRPALAAALTLAVLGPAGWWQWHTLTAARLYSDRAAHLATIHAERNRVALALAALREEHEASRPKIYVGGDEQTDLVVGLDGLAHAQRASYRLDK